MKKLFIIISISTLLFATENRKKVVILDTGIERDFPTEYLCSEGHKDFSGLGIDDTKKHGTHLAYIIKDYIDPQKQCLVIVKFYNDRDIIHSKGLPAALKYITTLNASYVNMSFGGDLPDFKEKRLIQELLDQGVIVVAAAGNSGKDLSFFCTYFPACYGFKKNFYVVGSCNNGKYSSFSNYGGPVNSCENGEKVKAGPYTFNGTSQATAIKTGKLIK